VNLLRVGRLVVLGCVAGGRLMVCPRAVLALQDKGAAKAKAAAAAKAKAKASADKGHGGKAAPVEKMQVVYEVKPAEAGQDMADLESRVRALSFEGLSWGEQFKVVDVAYGIQKLIIQFVIAGETTGLQEVEDAVRISGTSRAVYLCLYVSVAVVVHCACPSVVVYDGPPLLLPAAAADPGLRRGARFVG
jgi:translation elongation factor EF-1beta